MPGSVYDPSAMVVILPRVKPHPLVAPGLAIDIRYARSDTTVAQTMAESRVLCMFGCERLLNWRKLLKRPRER